MKCYKIEMFIPFFVAWHLLMKWHSKWQNIYFIICFLEYIVNKLNQTNMLQFQSAHQCRSQIQTLEITKIYFFNRGGGFIPHELRSPISIVTQNSKNTLFWSALKILQENEQYIFLSVGLRLTGFHSSLFDWRIIGRIWCY